MNLIPVRCRWSLLLVLLLPPRLCADSADLIVTAQYVITMDAQQRVIEDGAVAIRGERIVALGKRVDIDGKFQAKQRLDKGNAIVAPGLINTHTHAAMSLFRGIADDLNLQDWLTKFIFPAEKKNVTADFVKWGTKLAVLEMLLGGTTTYTDMYYFEDTVAATTKAAGMRGVLGETVIGFPVSDAPTPVAALKLTEGFLRHYHGDSLIVPAVATRLVVPAPPSLTRPAISPFFSARSSAPLDPSPSATAVSPMAARCATNHSKSCGGSRRSTTAVIGMPSSASQ